MSRAPAIVLQTLLGFAALGAGQAFVRDPSGETLGMTPDWIEGSPFRSFRVPGLFLALVIGSANLASAFMLWRRHPLAPFSSLAAGILLTTWIAVQTAIVGFRHWSQVLWWVTFNLVALLGAREVHRRPRG